MLTESEWQTTRSSSSHQIPHPQGLILPYTQGDLPTGMNVYAVHLARVTLEGSERYPISGSEDCDGGIFRGTEEMGGGWEGEGSDGTYTRWFVYQLAAI
jgi:hypothetical protein